MEVGDVKNWSGNGFLLTYLISARYRITRDPISDPFRESSWWLLIIDTVLI
jgi:hypothetical protein